MKHLVIISAAIIMWLVTYGSMQLYFNTIEIQAVNDQLNQISNDLYKIRACLIKVSDNSETMVW